jgi:hypothetical protein
MTFLQADAPLRLKVEGFRKPLRLRSLGRAGALETFTVEGQALQAVRFVPAGAIRETDGRLTATPEAADAYAAALDAFEALGRRLQALAPRAALPVRAVSRTASGCFWLQAAPGVSLEAWLAENPLPVAEPLAAAFARRLAEALEEIHAAGMVHGDLSPRTVLIDDGHVRLTGFMIDRRPFFRALRGQRDLVEPGYAPPEAHDGALRHPIGPAADLYAASALLQRLLTGRAPPAANLAARVTGDNPWPDGVSLSTTLRAGVDAGLAPVAEARPADARAWLAGLGLGPAREDDPWFEGLAAPSVAEPPIAPGPFDLPPLPMAASDPDDIPVETVETPLMLPRQTPPRRRPGWWIASAGLAAVAIAVALVAPKLGQRARAPSPAGASQAPVPVAPTGCQWISASDGWRLRCPDAPSQGLRLPERFDVQTPARAAAGEPAAMERLGAFYRLRAGETANPNRGAYAYQALDWLRRAAGALDDGRPDTARARDDAALALGQMLAHGEGGRAPDPAAAEARLRQAAAGSRADAVLALGQFLEAQARDDTDRLAQARGLYARVAQLADGSALQREGERGLARIDAATRPAPVEAAPPPAPAVEEPVAKPPAPAPKPTPPKARPAPQKPRVNAKPKATKAESPKPAIPLVRAPTRPATPPPRRPTATTPRAPAASAAPVLRTWTASAFIKVDPTTNFSPAVELAGRAACDSEGGETLSVRAGDTLCPNGVNYCQVRAVATCRGARP